MPLARESERARKVMGWETQEASARIRARHDRHNNEIMNDLFRPVASELPSSAGMLLEGAIPADFPGGAILKNGPNPKFDFEGQGGWLDGDGSEPYTLNLQPLTPNPQPQTMDPEPSALYPQPSTLNPEPSTLSPQP